MFLGRPCGRLPATIATDDDRCRLIATPWITLMTINSAPVRAKPLPSMLAPSAKQPDRSTARVPRISATEPASRRVDAMASPYTDDGQEELLGQLEVGCDTGKADRDAAIDHGAQQVYARELGGEDDGVEWLSLD